MSIRTKLIFMVGGLLVFVTVSIAVGLYLAEREALLQRLEATRQSTLHQYAQSCRDTLIVHDELAAISATQLLSGNAEVIEAAFMDGKGRILAHTDPQKIGKIFAGSLTGKEGKTRQSDQIKTDPHGTDRIILTERVPLGKGPPATAVIVFSQRVLEEFVRKSLEGLERRIVAVSAIALLIGLVGAWTLARHLIRPIETLAMATQRLASGELNHRVIVDRKDELGRLGHDFNQMAVKLGELDQMKEDFVSNVSHELRSPLSAIESYANAISDEWRAERKENIPDYLAILRNNATRLGRFINDILDTAKIEARAIDVRKQTIDPAVVMNDVVSLFLPKAKEKSIRLAAEKVSSGLSVCADPDKLHQILTNLTANALKFTPTEGRVTLQATTTTPAADMPLRDTIARSASPPAAKTRYTRISVADTGPGIRREDQDRIFNRFEQVQEIRNNIRGSKGTGLGLAIARGLAEAHGGFLGVESTPGRGSIFSIYLPMEE